MKKIIGYIFKIGIAAVISVILLSLFSLVYFNPPIAIKQPDMVTNFKYIPDRNWSFMLEGAGSGKTDTLGYNNAYYRELANPDIVFAGSSHMEALQVPQDKNFVYLLNEMFDKDNLPYNNLRCLNLGTSGHFFEVTASNYKYIAEKFKGAKYIVIEAFDVKFSPQMLDNILEEKFHEPMEDKGFIYETAQRVPFLRLMNKKINEAKSAKGTGETTLAVKINDDIDAYIDKMDKILNKIAKISAESNTKPIILLHERFWEDADRNIVMEMDRTYKNAFLKCCEANGIKIIDASAAMVEVYQEKHEVSYGFSNSVPGEGHLNETGHRIVAETLYKHINEMEEQK